MTRRSACFEPGCGCICHRATVRRSATLWLPGMDRRLREGLARGDSVEQVAATIGLSEGAVRWRIRALDLSTRDGWYSPTEIRALLGVTWRDVRRWIGDGLLVTEPHGRRWRRVRAADLVAFVGAYGGALFEPSSVANQELRRLAVVNAAVALRRAAP